ncbi:MAG TPA: DUF2975 domain-containing protein [Flavobacterium sp.]|jgi:hypothetical protein
MKNLTLLKALVDLFFFFGVLAVGGMLIILPIYILNPEMDLPIKIAGQTLGDRDPSTIIVVILGMAGALFFIYSIYRLRAVLALFIKHEIFSDNVSRHFTVIGQCIIASTFLTSVPMFFYNAIHRNKLGIEINGGGFDSFLMSTSLGLLFLVISEIFKKAKNMKEENELTV